MRQADGATHLIAWPILKGALGYRDSDWPLPQPGKFAVSSEGHAEIAAAPIDSPVLPMSIARFTSSRSCKLGHDSVENWSKTRSLATLRRAFPALQHSLLQI